MPKGNCRSSRKVAESDDLEKRKFYPQTEKSPPPSLARLVGGKKRKELQSPPIWKKK